VIVAGEALPKFLIKDTSDTKISSTEKYVANGFLRFVVLQLTVINKKRRKKSLDGVVSLDELHLDPQQFGEGSNQYDFLLLWETQVGDDEGQSFVDEAHERGHLKQGNVDRLASCLWGVDLSNVVEVLDEREVHGGSGN